MIPHATYPDGFFSECRNDMLRTTKKRTVVALAGTGHIQYLKTIGCKADATGLTALLAESNTHSAQHVTLPDDAFQYLRKDEYDDIDDNQHISDFRFPHRWMTISHLNTQVDVKQLFCLCPDVEENPDHTLIFPMSKARLNRFLSKEDHDLLDDTDKLTPKTFERLSLRSQGLSESVIRTAMAWSCNTFAFRFIPGSDQLLRHDWMRERQKADATDPQEAEEAATRCLADIITYIRFMQRPAEEVQVDYDPDWTPEKLTYTAKRKGAIEAKRPSRIRLYVPKRVTVGIDSEASGETRGPQPEHVRSGHWRTYKKTGRRVWVDSYVAGNPELGSTVGQTKTVELIPRR